MHPGGGWILKSENSSTQRLEHPHRIDRFGDVVDAHDSGATLCGQHGGGDGGGDALVRARAAGQCAEHRLA